MRIAEAALLLLLGAVPGGVGTALLASSWGGGPLATEAPVADRVEEEAGGAADPAGNADACDLGEVVAIQGRLALRERIAEERLAVLRKEEAAIVGHPLAWPDDLDPAYRRDAVRSSLDDLADQGFDVAAVDCDEYPCVAWVRSGDFDGPPPTESLADRGLQADHPVVAVEDVDGETLQAWLVVVWPEDRAPVGEDGWRRVKWRGQLLQADADSR